MQCRWRAGLVAVFFFATSNAVAQDATLDRARALIQANQGPAAYQLLEPLEQQRAGNVEYDYLLGVAAIDAAQYTRAVFALERVLAVQPNHAQARAEIARAYFLMGENKAARQEFESVKQSRPPEAVAVTIDQFLNALDARERSRRSGLTAFLEAGFGLDSNANSATSASTFAIPGLGGLQFSLAPGAQEQDDKFFALSGGAFGRYALNNTWSLIGNATFDQRFNADHDEFDTGTLNGSAGVTRVDEVNEFTLAAQLQTYSVDGEQFRNAAGGVAQWRRNFTQRDQATAYLQYARLTYPDAELRDADRIVIGGAWAHSYGGLSAAFAGVYGGREEPIEDNVPHFGHDLWGVRIGGQIGFGSKFILSATASYENREYGGPDPFFLEERHDKEAQLRFAGSYLLDGNWTATAALTLVDARSNIVVNDYERTMLTASLRYDFR
jgi:tetratricopeptide (TPR) repeat protein